MISYFKSTGNPEIFMFKFVILNFNNVTDVWNTEQTETITIKKPHTSQPVCG